MISVFSFPHYLGSSTSFHVCCWCANQLLLVMRFEGGRTKRGSDADEPGLTYPEHPAAFGATSCRYVTAGWKTCRYQLVRFDATGACKCLSSDVSSRDFDSLVCGCLRYHISMPTTNTHYLFRSLLSLPSLHPQFQVTLQTALSLRFPSYASLSVQHLIRCQHHHTY